MLITPARAGDPVPASAPNGTVTVLTYNVLHHTDTFVDAVKSLVRGTPLPTDRIAPTLDLLVRLNADIIALQEVTPVFITAVRADARMNAWHVTSTLPPEPRGWRRYLAAVARYLFGVQPWGQAILTRWPVTGVHIYPLGRPLLVTEIAIDGLPLTVATCHPDSFPENRLKRRRQLQQAFRRLGSASNALLPGDFNFGDDGPEQQVMHTAYADIRRRLEADAPGYSYPVAVTMPPPGITPRRLDRLLLRSRRLEPLDVALIGGKPAAREGKAFYLSDHYGVIARLRRTGS